MSARRFAGRSAAWAPTEAQSSFLMLSGDSGIEADGRRGTSPKANRYPGQTPLS
jgi:hypothetical protein